jgi:limonene-1,2-epoxide hydrolase
MHAFRAAVEARDHAAIVATLAPDVLIYSPVAHRPFAGRDAAAELFRALMETFEDFHYTHEFADGDTTALIFRTRIGDREAQGLDLVHVDADGVIDELTVMLRPVSALAALGERLAPRVAGLAKAR